MIGDTEYRLSKDWTNASDFPTYEENEEKVREDMQLLFDELRDCINDLVNKISAGNIACAEFGSGIFEGGSIYEALEELLRQAQAAATGDITDGSIEGRHLHVDSVTTAKIADGNVTAAKIAQNAVTSEKIYSLDASKLTGVINSQVALNVGANDIEAGAVGTGKLADNAVIESKIANGAVTTGKLADSAVTDAKIASGAVKNSHIESVAATKLTGTVSAERLPDVSALVTALAASVITSGELDAARIPSLPASKIGSGELDAERIPAATAEALGGVRISYGTEADRPENPVAGQIFLQYVGETDSADDSAGT